MIAFAVTMVWTWEAISAGAGRPPHPLPNRR